MFSSLQTLQRQYIIDRHTFPYLFLLVILGGPHLIVFKGWILLALHLGVNPGGLRGPYVLPMSKPMKVA